MYGSARFQNWQKPVKLGDWQAEQDQAEQADEDTLEKRAREFVRQQVESGEISGRFARDDDGNEFFIIDGWDHVEAINALFRGNPELQDPSDYLDSIEDLRDVFGWNWGFYDEYTACTECGGLIRTQPDSYAWTADFWESEGFEDCNEIGLGYHVVSAAICGDCVRKDPSDYLDELVARTLETQKPQVSTIVDPEDHGWVPVIADLENGLHHGQNDDPRPLVAWAVEHGFQPLFTISPGQFDVSFTLYLRRDAPEADTGEYRKLDSYEVVQIRAALLEDADASYPRLRREFKQYPTPAQRLERALKSVPPLPTEPGIHVIEIEI